VGEQGHDVAELVAALGFEARVAEHFIIDALTPVTAGECVADPTIVAPDAA
jgi:hypothetical protein